MAVRPRSDVIRCHSEPPSVTDMSISAWPDAADKTSVGLFLGLCEKVPAEKPPEEEDQEDDHQRCADDFSQRQLPAQQRHHDDAELQDEIGGSHLKCHCGREMRALAEDR